MYCPRDVIALDNRSLPLSHGSMRRMLINAKLIEMMKRYGRIEKMTSRKTKKKVGNFGEWKRGSLGTGEVLWEPRPLLWGCSGSLWHRICSHPQKSSTKSSGCAQDPSWGCWADNGSRGSPRKEQGMRWTGDKSTRKTDHIIRPQARREASVRPWETESLCVSSDPLWFFSSRRVNCEKGEGGGVFWDLETNQEFCWLMI